MYITQYPEMLSSSRSKKLRKLKVLIPCIIRVAKDDSYSYDESIRFVLTSLRRIDYHVLESYKDFIYDNIVTEFYHINRFVIADALVSNFASWDKLLESIDTEKYNTFEDLLMYMSDSKLKEFVGLEHDDYASRDMLEHIVLSMIGKD